MLRLIKIKCIPKMECISVCRKSRFWNFKPKVFWSSNFSKMLAESKGRAFGRSPQ